MATLQPAGQIARDMAGLWWLMLWLGAAVMVAFLVLLAISVRDREGAEDARRLWLIGGGVVLPVVVVGITFAATLTTMRDIPDAAPPDALQVHVTASQYHYEVSYPDQGIVVTNQLHLPVDQQVAVTLRSTDVVHSFWVPQLAGKTDMLPDGPTTIVLHADEAGTYAGRCAEFCGLEHTQMGFDAVVHEQADFDAWLAEAAG